MIEGPEFSRSIPQCGTVRWKGPAWFTGGPSQDRIRQIYSLTGGYDARGRRFFRRAMHMNWEKLETPESYKVLNEILAG